MGSGTGSWGKTGWQDSQVGAEGWEKCLSEGRKQARPVFFL